MAATKFKINVNAEVTNRLQFEPQPEINNLCLGYLTGVKVNRIKSEPDANWEYAGQEYNQLVLEFIQHKELTSDKDRFHTETELPIASMKKEKEGSKILVNRAASDIEDSINQLWGRIKHIHDQFKNVPNFKPIESMPDILYDAKVVDRLKSYDAFFEALAEAFVGTDGQPIYGTTENKMLVMKLVASERQGKKSNYRVLAFPRFVGKGFVETARIINGKLHTTLAFTTNETVNTKTTTKVPIIEGVSNSGLGNTESDAALKAKLGIAG